MFLVRFALGNPHAVLALALGLSFVGLAVLPATPADILPDFKTPVVTSYFSYPGMPTEEMEWGVTNRIERVLTLAGRLERIESRTLPGASVIKAYFRPGTDPSAAANDVVNLQASDLFHLPPGIEYPFTMRTEPGNLPVVLAAVSGEGLSETELYTIGYYAVRNRMGGLEGVQVPHPFGGRYRQMMIYVDPEKLQAQGLAAVDVVAALRQANLVLSAGTLKLGKTDYQVHPVNTLLTPQDIDAVPLAVRDGRPVFIRDVGFAKDDAAIQYNIVRVNGQRSVYVPLLREPGSNTIQVVDHIRKTVEEEVPRMKERGEIPRSAEVHLLADQSVYIRNAIRNLQYEVGLGALLVAVVVGLFLRQFKPTLAIVLVIPFSLVIGMLGFYFTSHTINVMTLGGLTLAVGTVVDAGIVIVENIVRHLRMGKPARQAAGDGAEEVAAPVLAGTVTTLAVFLPAVFLSGMIQYLFQPLALAAVFTIAASYVVAMTLVPAFCARFLRQRRGGGPDVEAEIPEPRGLYAALLRGALRYRLVVIAGTALLMLAASLLYFGTGTELFPEVDAGTFEVRVRTVPGTRVEETEKVVQRVEQAIRRVIPPEEIETITANIGLPLGKGAGFATVLSSNSGPDSAFLIVNLKQDGRAASTGEYVRRLRPALAEEFPQEQFLFTTGSIINAALNEGAPTPINIQVAGGSLEQMRHMAEQLAARVGQIPGAVDVQIAQAGHYPQFEIQVDRTRAAYLGVTQRDVAQNILTALGSSVGFAPTVWIDPRTGIDFWMGVQYKTNEAQSLDELHNLPLALKTSSGPVTVPLSNVATVRRVSIPAEVAHYKIARVFEVYVNVDGRDLGSVAAEVERVIAETPRPAGTTVTVRGPVATMRSGARMLGVGLLTAVLLVYLTMLAQFRSFVDPLIILLAVPPGIAGVLAILVVTGTTLNIQSLIGALMMIGVVVNNSILLVEFANVLRERGYDARRAALAAAQIRLRPILMTALVLVASVLPLSFHLAPGSEAMVPLARALLGGMLASTFVTLFLVPCVYSLVKGSRTGSTA
ncbi:MAG: efflux RND transporter permease subunit [Gemmataceae bacterium]|nr:efflux RND transporter permease subunit [Gemmataceae bacterium]